MERGCDGVKTPEKNFGPEEKKKKKNVECLKEKVYVCLWPLGETASRGTE
jgi:hypothetical protein